MDNADTQTKEKKSRWSPEQFDPDRTLPIGLQKWPLERELPPERTSTSGAPLGGRESWVGRWYPDAETPLSSSHRSLQFAQAICSCRIICALRQDDLSEYILRHSFQIPSTGAVCVYLALIEIQIVAGFPSVLHLEDAPVTPQATGVKSSSETASANATKVAGVRL
ncbi:hypothetical protein PF010_g1005 [Phytophthora fragariae]|uniref:Uncharacterized protein n=1 Tax=Phytophthora fragariae TaxID=53985 RepID=A0A6G0M203_9STRA|nr:hypothetical protein PF010_g1005 [Phytophthora fragariae]